MHQTSIYSASLLASTALFSEKFRHFFRSEASLTSFTTVFHIGHNQLYPLVPLYSKILHPLIIIVICPPESLNIGGDPVPLSLCLHQAIS